MFCIRFKQLWRCSCSECSRLRVMGRRLHLLGPLGWRSGPRLCRQRHWVRAQALSQPTSTMGRKPKEIFKWAHTHTTQTHTHIHTCHVLIPTNRICRIFLHKKKIGSIFNQMFLYSFSVSLVEARRHRQPVFNITS